VNVVLQKGKELSSSALSATAVRPRARSRPDVARGRWLRFTGLAFITILVNIPVVAVVILSLQPPLAAAGSASSPLASFGYVFTQTATPQWLGNTLVVTGTTVAVTMLVSAPAGYVLSRSRHRLVSGYSLLLFVVQTLPVIVSVIPLFLLFAKMGFVDSLVGVVIVYVGQSMAVATWMMASYFDSIPVSLEEAAWIDGCSVFGSFLRVVLRNSLPGVLSTAIFSFLHAWNDYLVAVVFLRSTGKLTLGVGLQTFFSQNGTDWGPIMATAVIILLPPLVIFTLFNRFFSIGGIGGALAGD
jgi:multiple sugar transport system permease protein